MAPVPNFTLAQRTIVEEAIAQTAARVASEEAWAAMEASIAKAEQLLEENKPIVAAADDRLNLLSMIEDAEAGSAERKAAAKSQLDADVMTKHNAIVREHNSAFDSLLARIESMKSDIVPIKTQTRASQMSKRTVEKIKALKGGLDPEHPRRSQIQNTERMANAFGHEPVNDSIDAFVRKLKEHKLSEIN